MTTGYVDCIYSTELEIKDTTDIASSASYLDIHVEIEDETTREFISNFPSWTFLLMEYISQLIWYARAWVSHQDFLDIELLLTRKLQKQGFLVAKLKLSYYIYRMSVSQITMDIFSLCSQIGSIPCSQHHQIVNMSNKPGATSGAGAIYDMENKNIHKGFTIFF